LSSEDQPAGPAVGARPIPSGLEPRAPLFFVSHANARMDGDFMLSTEDPNEPFLEFFTALSLDVGQLDPRRAGADPGFIDRGIPPGRDWEAEILGAVASTQVFIGLVSNPYLNSEWCGFEWDAFTRRRTRRRSDGAATGSHVCVLPVLWAPARKPLPAAVRACQWFSPLGLKDPGIAARYEKEGLFGLLNTDEQAFKATVWRLAMKISRLIEDYWVEPEPPCTLAELGNAFERRES
jgi:hypothetical protein